MKLELAERASLRVRDRRCSVRFHKELAAQRAVSVLLPVFFKPYAVGPGGQPATGVDLGGTPRRCLGGLTVSYPGGGRGQGVAAGCDLCYPRLNLAGHP